MSCCQYRLPRFIGFPVTPIKIAVSSYNLFVFGIPYYQLTASTLHGIEFVNIHGLSCASSRCPESDFTQASYLPHYMRAFSSRNNINIVVALVCCTKFAFRSQFASKKRFTDWCYNLFFHILPLVRLIRHVMQPDLLVRKLCFQHIVPIRQVYAIYQTFARE